MRSELIGKSNNGSSSSIESEEVYNNNGEKLVLALSLELYSKLDWISISTSRPFSCSTSHYLLITQLTTTLRIILTWENCSTLNKVLMIYIHKIPAGFNTI